ncbi:unnamed protein product, partial [Pylaiella littoralis]
ATHNAVFAHRGIIPLLRNVRSSAVATGLRLGAPGTALGNKGGVGISFNIGTTSCIFVNSHLAAHQNNVRERNDHFYHISHGLMRELGPPRLCIGSSGGGGSGGDRLLSMNESAPTATPAPSADSEQPPPGTKEGDTRTRSRISSDTLPTVFDRVVWAGDLNYRINAPRGVADLLLSKDMHDVLLKNEQLSLERSRHIGKAGRGGEGGTLGDPLVPFSGYSEGPLNFRPTYKFDSGTDTYDTSTKQRVPAWTDRILYSGTGTVELRAYRSVRELKTSDHRPVLASFVMKFDQRQDGGDGDSGVEGAAVTNQTSSQVCSVM